MNQINFSDLEHFVKDLDSQEIEKQVLAIEEIAETVDEIVTLIEALNQLNTEIPLEIYERLKNSDVPWRILLYLFLGTH